MIAAAARLFRKAPAEPPRLAARRLRDEAEVDLSSGRDGRAERKLKRSLSLLKPIKDDEGVAAALLLLARLRLFQRRAADAGVHARAAAALFAGVGDMRNAAMAQKLASAAKVAAGRFT